MNRTFVFEPKSVAHGNVKEKQSRKGIKKIKRRIKMEIEQCGLFAKEEKCKKKMLNECQKHVFCQRHWHLFPENEILCNV